MPTQKYIRRTDVPSVYGVSDRQLKRWLADKRIRCHHPAGARGPCFLSVAALDALFEGTPSKASR